MATPEAGEARRHHEREQLLRGDHPHDHGRYIQPPLVWSILRPIVARYRTVHVDLAGWPEWKPLLEILRVTVVLSPTNGERRVYVAEPSEDSRRYAVELPAEPNAPGWLAAGSHRVHVLVSVAGEAEPRTWTPVVKDGEGRKLPLELVIAEEPRRPLVTGQEVA